MSRHRQSHREDGGNRDILSFSQSRTQDFGIGAHEASSNKVLFKVEKVAKTALRSGPTAPLKIDSGIGDPALSQAQALEEENPYYFGYK